jgi:hypothetical protein
MKYTSLWKAQAFILVKYMYEWRGTKDHSPAFRRRTL